MLEVAHKVADGWATNELARKAARGDKSRQKQLTHKFRRWEQRDDFQMEVMRICRARSLYYLGPSVKGIGRRASMGNPMAAKLMWAMMGFHSDKVDHKHSGDINIRVSIPRPPATVDKLGLEEPIVDADVVDD